MNHYNSAPSCQVTITFAVLALLFVAGCSPADDATTASREVITPAYRLFDGARAFELLKKQVAFGPRVPGSEGHRACGDFVEAELRRYTDDVQSRHFEAHANGRKISLRNIIARFNRRARTQVLLCAHWDTRPTADCEVTVEKRRCPIPGANDGASGAAVLLELARIFSIHKPPVGIVMVFFDGEDYGPGQDAMFLGAKQFAAEYVRLNGLPDRNKIQYGLLLDMVGDADLRITADIKSVATASDVIEKTWKTAEALGYGSIFVRSPVIAINDDHIPLIDAGIKCIDIIDFEYGPWHTLDDTPDQCSAKSLEAVGEVVAAVIYEETSPKGER